MGGTDVAEFHVRSYQAEDRDACRTLWAELTERHRELYGDPTIGGDDPGRHFDEHLERVGAGCIWVAESKGEVLGFIGLILRDQEGEIEPAIVGAGHRGKGIGRALLERAVEEAKARGMRLAVVRPVARNADAIAFFYNCGFCALGQLELVKDLGVPPSVVWRGGLDLLGHEFSY